MPRKMPTLTTEVAMPECSGRLTSFATVHVSVKPGISNPISTNHASVAGSGHCDAHDPRQPRQRVQPRIDAHHRAAAAESIGNDTDDSAPNATPSSSALACCAATTRDHAVAVSTRNGTAHRPANARKLPPMPRLTKKPGHVAAFASTRRSATGQRSASAVSGCRSVDRREAALLGAIAHDDPRGDAQHRRDERQPGEDRAPRHLRHEPRERCAGDHRAEIAGEHRDAVERRKPIGGKPDRADLEQRDERDRHADADQRASRPPRSPSLARARTRASRRRRSAIRRERMRRGPIVSASTPTGICSSV